MASGRIVARTPMEALQRSLGEEKVAHGQCQRRMQVLTMELRLSQKKADHLEKRLAEERRSHEYFKRRFAAVKATNCVTNAHSESALAEVAALSAEKEVWLAEKQSLLQEQACLTTKLDKCSKQIEAAASCRMALHDALAQSQTEVAVKKDELLTQQAELHAMEKQPRVPECAICFEHAVSIVFTPCGHACVCERCADMALDECPLCREAVGTKTKLHFA